MTTVVVWRTVKFLCRSVAACSFWLLGVSSMLVVFWFSLFGLGFMAIVYSADVFGISSLFCSTAGILWFRFRWLYLAWMYSLGLLFPIGVISFPTAKFPREDVDLGVGELYSSAKLVLQQVWSWLVSASSVVLGTNSAPISVQMIKFGVHFYGNYNVAVAFVELSCFSMECLCKLCVSLVVVSFYFSSYLGARPFWLYRFRPSPDNLVPAISG